MVVFQGKWSPRMIPNPDYFEDKHPYKMVPIVSVILYYAIGITVPLRLWLALWCCKNYILYYYFYICCCWEHSLVYVIQ